MDDLARIERNYGCVAEYQRQFEYEWAEHQKQYEKCRINKEKLEKAGDKAMYFCVDCFGCEHYEGVGPTHIRYLGSYSVIDDVPHGICHGKGKENCR